MRRTRFFIVAGLLLALAAPTAPVAAGRALEQDGTSPSSGSTTTSGPPVGDGSPLLGGHLLTDGLSHVLADLHDLVVDGVEQQVGLAISAAASNPCSGSGPLRTTDNGSVRVLLLGSDYRRRPYIGERTDTVIVMNVARNGRVAMAAIPRDTVRIPLSRGGTSGGNRINSLYIRYKRSGGAHGVDCRALNRVRLDVAKALDTRIPYYALIRMDQFQQLLYKIGGIKMDIRYSLSDEHFRRRDRKIWVPRANDYQMNGIGKCGPKPKKCRNALKYARSRYGTEGGRPNNDFRRLRRQQEIVFWTIKRVRARGDGVNLTKLLGQAKGRIYTNLPKTVQGARALYAHAQGASFREKDGVVFGPSKWATNIRGTYTYYLRLGAVRQWVDHHFRP
jgi:anionic cell wall polymer biosynthesis LytR-Cps2A-Psr (LCP) family protein